MPQEKFKRRWYRWRWLPLLVALLSVSGGWFAFRGKEASERPVSASRHLSTTSAADLYYLNGWHSCD